MASVGPDSPRFVVVPHRPYQRLLLLALALAWLGSLVATAYWASGRAAPELAEARATVHAQAAQIEADAAALRELRQEVATLRRSDQISRAANIELQSSLAEREEEVSGLRADIDFYERLVGATGQRRGLSVHDAVFAPENGGSWRYTITLTQNLNRGAISKGELRMTLEGVVGGRMRKLSWTELRQAADGVGQPFSFRYFQQLEGSVVLPAGFTPQRVRVQLRADGATVDQDFPWKASGT